jgi:hypothetical protein
MGLDNSGDSSLARIQGDQQVRVALDGGAEVALRGPADREL